MNINIIYSIVLNVIIISMVTCSPCSIYPLLNCSCYQSDNDLYSSSSIKTYSHLYCQGKLLSKKTFQSPFGLDFQHQNRFRTISIEFLVENEVEISRNQFDSLALLFSRTNDHEQIEISIRLNGFSHIRLNEKSVTSNIFRQNHQNRHLTLHLIPKLSKYIQVKKFIFLKLNLLNNLRMNPVKIVRLI
jgi:hypothetical protein